MPPSIGTPGTRHGSRSVLDPAGSTPYCLSTNVTSERAKRAAFTSRTSLRGSPNSSSSLFRRIIYRGVVFDGTISSES